MELNVINSKFVGETNSKICGMMFSRKGVGIAKKLMINGIIFALHVILLYGIINMKIFNPKYLVMLEEHNFRIVLVLSPEKIAHIKNSIHQELELDLTPISIPFKVSIIMRDSEEECNELLDTIAESSMQTFEHKNKLN